MNYDPDKHHRRSIRMRGYDYAQEGVYFVTVCAQDRQCLFGEIVDGEIRLNDAGRMIERWWFELNHKFPTVETDEFVVTPNHFHGIVVIADVTVGADLCVGLDSEGAHAGAPLRAPAFAPRRVPLPTVVQWFKTMTTNEYIRGIKTLGWTSFRYFRGQYTAIPSLGGEKGRSPSFRLATTMTRPASTSSGSGTKAWKNPIISPTLTSLPRKSPTTSKPLSSNSAKSRWT